MEVGFLVLSCPFWPGLSSPVLSSLIRAGVDRSPVSFRFVPARAAESFDGAKGTIPTPERHGTVGCGLWVICNTYGFTARTKILIFFAHSHSRSSGCASIQSLPTYPPRIPFTSNHENEIHHRTCRRGCAGAECGRRPAVPRDVREFAGPFGVLDADALLR